MNQVFISISLPKKTSDQERLTGINFLKNKYALRRHAWARPNHDWAW